MAGFSAPTQLTNVHPSAFALLPEDVQWVQTEAKGSRRMLPKHPARLPRHLPRLPNQLPKASQPLGQLLIQPLPALSRQLPPTRPRHLWLTQTPLTWLQQRLPLLYPTAASIQASIFPYRHKRHHWLQLASLRCPQTPVHQAFLQSFRLETETTSIMPVCRAYHSEITGSAGLPDSGRVQHPRAFQDH